MSPTSPFEDDHHGFEKGIRAARLASRRLQYILDHDDTPSKSAATAAINTRSTEAQPMTKRVQPAEGVVVEENVREQTGGVGITEPCLLSPFRDQRKTKRNRRSRRQGMVFQDRGQAYGTGDAKPRQPRNEDVGVSQTKGKAKKKSTKAVDAVKAANDDNETDGTATNSNNNVSDNETGNVGKRKRTISLGSDADVTDRILADSPTRRNWQRNGAPKAETGLMWTTLSHAKSHPENLRGVIKGGGPDESRQSKSKDSLDIVREKHDLDIDPQSWRDGRLEATEQSSKRGQLKRPDLERVRRA